MTILDEIFEIDIPRQRYCSSKKISDPKHLDSLKPFFCHTGINRWKTEKKYDGNRSGKLWKPLRQCLASVCEKAWIKRRIGRDLHGKMTNQVSQSCVKVPLSMEVSLRRSVGQSTTRNESETNELRNTSLMATLYRCCKSTLLLSLRIVALCIGGFWTTKASLSLLIKTHLVTHPSYNILLHVHNVWISYNNGRITKG